MEQFYPPDHTISLPDETIQKWKSYLEEQDRIKKEEKHQEMIKRLSADPNYEKYRAHVLKNGRTERDFGFESLYLLHKHLEETPKEELESEFKKVEDMAIEGPTVDEYFESLNPGAQYQKGYSECAKKFKDAVTEKLRNDVDENGLSKHYSVDDFIKLINDIYNKGSFGYNVS